MKYCLYGGYHKVNPDLVATLLDLGKVSRDLDAPDDARFYFKAALDGLYAIHGYDAKNAQLAATLTQLGGLSYCAGILDDAKKYFQKSLDVKLHLYGKDAHNDDLASTLNNLGSLHARLKNHKEAFYYYELSLEQYKMLSDEEGNAPDIKSHQARTLHNLGLLSFNLQEFDAAKKYFAASLKLKSEVFKDVEDSPDLALTLSKLSSVEVRQGKFEAAKYYQDQAIKRSPTFLETHRNLINKNLLPATAEEAAALIALVPHEGNTESQILLKSLDFWTNQSVGDEEERTKTCWYPFWGRRYNRKAKKNSKKIRGRKGKRSY